MAVFLCYFCLVLIINCCLLLKEVKILFCEPKNSDLGCIDAPHSCADLAVTENLKFEVMHDMCPLILPVLQTQESAFIYQKSL